MSPCFFSIMGNLWHSVNLVMKESDIVVIVLDARFITETINHEIVRKINEQKKPYLFVVTKSDLKESIDKSKIPEPYVIVSSTERRGKSALRERLLIIAEKRYGRKCAVKVGVLGYPNVGKSSVINMLKGRHSASTSIMSGHTRAEKFIRADNRILLMDTPGVIPYGENDQVKHVLIGTTDFTKVKHPETILEDIMERYPGVIEKHFGVTPDDSRSGTIEKIAMKKGLLRKGGLPDTDRAARMIIRLIQTGKLRIQ